MVRPQADWICVVAKHCLCVCDLGARIVWNIRWNVIRLLSILILSVTKHRKTIAKLILFVALVFLGDRAGGYVLSKIVGSTGQRFPMIYAGKLPSDIMVLGNSRGIHMFHPPAIEKVTSRRVVNLSFNDLSPTIMPVLWSDYLQNHDPPELLVLEISSIIVVDYPGSLERFSILMNRNQEIGEIIRERNQVHYYAAQISHLFRFNSPLTWRSLLFLKKTDQSWIMTSQFNENMMADTIANADAELRRDENRMRAVRRTIEIAREHGIEVRAVVAPYAPGYFQRLDGFNDWLAWAEESLGVKISDQTQTIQEMESFADHMHLNESGAAVFADKLDAQGFFD